jgi:hypothetical protein
MGASFGISILVAFGQGVIVLISTRAFSKILATISCSISAVLATTSVACITSSLYAARISTSF